LEVVVFRSFVRVLCLAGSLASLAAHPLGAQEKSARETKAASNVPESAQPPAGLCRVWLDNVPASQQPAPTDCATAIKNRPASAHLLFGNLKDEVAKVPQKPAAVQPANPRTNGWQSRPSDSHRFDTGPGIPSHQAEPRPNDGAGGVHPVSATTTVVRPTSDSGPKRRP
jgi:hypothetical protein